MDEDEASAETLAAPAANLPTLDASSPEALAAASAGGELAARARLPIVQREVYEVLGEFARGGLGRIVRARDTRSGRLVAIKEMLKGTPDAAARFEREAVVTANLQHPAIVPVYEVGRWPDHEPFFAMKLVKGRSLYDAIARAKDREARLALLPHVIAVSEALAYAHAEGWIHRDLKPHNVLVGDHGETVVIDWGLARRASDREQLRPVDPTESAPDQTAFGAVIGTPAYMAPEQASGVPVDERADVYAIGAMLRHLLVGAPAFADSKDVHQLLLRVRTVAPEPLASVAAWLPADLIAIVERAMAREPDDRYATAGALAEDLRRFTTGQLVAAHRYTRRERLVRFVRRNRAALAVAAIALGLSAAWGVWSVRKIVAERDRARAETKRAEAATLEADQQRTTATARLATLFADRGRLELLDGDPQRALPYLAEAMQLGEDTPVLRFVAARALEQVDRVDAVWFVDDFVQAEFVPGGDDVIVVEQDAVGRRGLDGTERWRVGVSGADAMAFVGADRVALGVPGGVRVLDLGSGAQRADLRVAGVDTVPGVIAASPDGALVIAGYDDGTARAWQDGKLTTFATGGPVDYAVILDGGAKVIVGGDASMQEQPTTVWDPRTGKQLAELCPAAQRCTRISATRDGRVALGRITGVLGGVDRVDLLDASLGGKRGFDLAATAVDLALLDDRVLVISNRTLDAYGFDGALRWTVAIGTGGHALAVSDDGARAVVSTVTGDQLAVDVATGVVTARQHPAFNADVLSLDDAAAHVLSWGRDHTATVWDTRRPQVIPVTTTAQRTWRFDLADATTAIAGTEDGEVSIRDAATGAERLRIHAHTGVVLQAQVWPRVGLITASGDGTACQWVVATGAKVRCWDHGVKIRRAEPSPDGARLATAGADGTIKVWDVATGALRTSWSLPRSAMSLRWSPDGTKIASIDEVGDVGVHDAATGDVLRDERGPPGNMLAGVSLEISPDGRLVVAGRMIGRHTLIDLANPKGDVTLLNTEGVGLLFGVGFSPDGRRVAGAGNDQHLHVWDVALGTAVHSLDTGADVHALAWSPDGALIATGGSDHRVHVFDAVGGVEVSRLEAPGDVYTLELSAERVAVGTDTPTALLWHLPAFTGTPGDLAALVACRSLWRLEDELLVPNGKPRCP